MAPEALARCVMSPPYNALTVFGAEMKTTAPSGMESICSLQSFYPFHMKFLFPKTYIVTIEFRGSNIGVENIFHGIGWPDYLRISFLPLRRPKGDTRKEPAIRMFEFKKSIGDITSNMY